MAPRSRWRAIAVRAFAVVFALSVCAPVIGWASDLAYHGRGQHAAIELIAVDAPSSKDAADPGVACHLHCGCHQLASVAVAPALPVGEAVKLIYAPVVEKLSPLAPNGLLRPPVSA